MDAWVHLNVAEPIVAWHAYRGVLQSAPTVHEELITPWMVVALRAAAEARHDWWVRRERMLEETRASTAPAAVSRLTGFFAFPDHATAEDRIAAWGWEHTNLAQIDIGQGAKISRHDSQWIEQMGTSPQVSQAEAYVRGDAFNSTPKWELLIEGSARILGTTLRMCALEVVREVWPDSLFFAEIGRLGALVGENAGYMSPQLFKVDGPHVGVRWLMADVPDAPEFASKIGELIANTPNGEVNFQAIGDINGPDLRSPDTRAMEFRLPRAYAERLLDW